MKKWFYYIEGAKAVGPLEEADILARIRERKVGPYQLMLRDGETDWNPALSFAEFRDVLASVRTATQLAKPWVVLRRTEAHRQPVSFGPFSTDEILQQLRSGQLQYVDYAWKDGMHQWRRLGQLKDFAPEKKPTVTPAAQEPKLPPPEKIGKAEVLRTVEVVKKKEPPKPEEKPPEARGEDLAASQTPPQRPEATAPIPLRPPAVTAKIPIAKPPTPVPPAPPAPTPSKTVTKTVPPVQSKLSQTSSPSPQTPLSPPPTPSTPSTPQASQRPEPPRPQTPVPPPPPKATVTTTALPPEPVAVSDEKRSEEPRDDGRGRADRRRSRRAVERERRRRRSREASFWKRLTAMEIELPVNWKQILIVALIVGGAALKIFQPDHLTVEAPPPPPPLPPPATPQASQRPEPPPIETAATESEPEQPAPISHPPASRLHVRIVPNGDSVALSIDTNAPSEQPVWLEVTGAAGMVLDRSHFYRKWAWHSNTARTVPLDGFPLGYFRVAATAGTLTDEAKFELGTHTKGFSDRMRWSRKRLSYEFWSERKNLYLAAKQLSKQLSSSRKNLNAIDRIARFDPTKFAFFDLWRDLKEICKLAHKDTESARERLQSLQSRIAQLSVWR